MDVKNVTYLANVKNDNGLVNPEGALLDALSEIRSGSRRCSSLLIITLDNEKDSYDVGFYASRLRGSEMVALCSRFVHIIQRLIDNDEEDY